MSVWKNPTFYFRSIATFLVIVLIDWLIESGFQLFRGRSFSEVTDNYKIPFTYLAIAAAIVYSNLKRSD
ncbi:hypothetical protein FHK02_4949 [Spirosoma sp. LMG 31448]|uniref:Uncharacterized protein n=1 Tax=Spirosoma utsteinense TaxID=2585773 RepID=A0ABR6WCQ2_9BACT|nr:hypothetical protein [Spirosoma utsteinense]MBC3794341.1 hypothetical protein [Spirosoma utsteinense]